MTEAERAAILADAERRLPALQSEAHRLAILLRYSPRLDQEADDAVYIGSMLRSCERVVLTEARLERDDLPPLWEPVCRIDGCTATPRGGSDLCRSHLNRLDRYGDPRARLAA